MPIHTKEKFFKLSFESCGWGQTSYDRVQRIVKLWTLEINWKLSGVFSAQWQAKRVGIPSIIIIIMDLAVHIEKVTELGRECRVLKWKQKKT